MKRFLLLLTLMAGCSSGKSAATGQPSTAAALMLRAFRLVSDDGGQTPAANAVVNLLFEPGGVADLYLATDTAIDGRKGSYTYDGKTLKLTFTDSDFHPDESFAIDLSQTMIKLPFRVFSTDAGSSTWEVDSRSLVRNLFLVANAALASDAITIEQALDRAVAYGNALIPGAKADNAWPTGYPLVESVIRYDNALEVCYAGASCIDVQIFPFTTDPTTGSEVVQSPIVAAPDLNEVNLPSVPEPNITDGDPMDKTALFILPFKGSQHVNWQVFRGSATQSVTLTSWNADLLDATQKLQGQAPFNYDDIEAKVTAQGFAVTELADGAATLVNIVDAVVPLTAPSNGPGVLYIDTHGSRRGELTTADAAPVAETDWQEPQKWQAEFDRFLANVANNVGTSVLVKDASRSGYKMFNHLLVFADARAAQGSAMSAFDNIAVKPAFWQWLREERGADFSRSLVYIGGCDTDYPLPTAQPADLLRNAFRARAYFAWAQEVNTASASVFYYIVQQLYRHTHTAEEAYYNVLRVLRTKQWIFDEDRILDKLGTQPCKEEPQGTLPATNPCTVGDREGLAQNFHGYSSDGQSDAVNFLDGGWLTDPKPGNTWWLLFKSRWFSTGSGAVQSLSDCWNAWWAPPKMQAGGLGDTCTPEAPGEAPSQDEVAVAAYLLSGTAAPFSTSKKLLPRWTWNDGH